MKEVTEKKYLGAIISQDGHNEINIKEGTNKATGNINKIVSTLSERPFGRHRFKSLKLMRDGILLGSLLTNIESWINITKANIEDLEKPDTHLLRKVLAETGNPCKVFMMLELGFTPVRFVIMQKRLQFLHYILKESTESMIRQVFETLKSESRYGDFVYLTNRDKIDLDIELVEQEIEAMSKRKWKIFLKEKTRKAALSYLVNENNNKDKTKAIKFEKLEMSQYLKENSSSSLSQTIFSIRSKTLDIKEFLPWKYSDTDCVKCEKFPETMTHFATCLEYKTEEEKHWEDIFINNPVRQKEIGMIIQKRMEIRKEIVQKQEDGQASTNSGSTCSI